MNRLCALRPLLAICCALGVAAASPTTASGRTLAEIRADGTLRIGVSDDPRETQDRRRAQQIDFTIGMDQEIALYLAERFEEHPELKLRTEFVRVPSAERIPALREGRVDLVVASLSVTEQRSRVIDYSEPYFTNPGLAVLARTDGSVRSNADLAHDITIGVVANSTAQRAIEQMILQFKWDAGIETVARVEEGVTEVRSGDIDAFVGDFSRLLFYEQNDEHLEIVDEPFAIAGEAEDRYAIGLQKGSAELKRHVDAFLADARVEAIVSRWFRLSNMQLLFRIKKIQGGGERMSQDVWVPLAAGGAVLFLLIVILVMGMRHRKALSQLDTELGAVKNVSGEVRDLRNSLASQTLNAQAIQEVGISYFRSCRQQVVYVGAEGFIAKKENEEWRQAVTDCIMGGRTLIRVVDLCDVREMSRYAPSRVEDYCVWLIRQYRDLKLPATSMDLYMSRSAPLWGTGFITMLKDRDEFMVFTAGSNKVGQRVRADGTVDGFCEKLDDILQNAHPLKPEEILHDLLLVAPDGSNGHAIHQAIALACGGSSGKATLADIHDHCRAYLKEIERS